MRVFRRLCAAARAIPNRLCRLCGSGDKIELVICLETAQPAVCENAVHARLRSTTIHLQLLAATAARRGLEHPPNRRRPRHLQIHRQRDSQLRPRVGIDKTLARVVTDFGAVCPHHAYLFPNKRANRMKVLVYDGIGIWLAALRLHRGKFVWPAR